MLRSVRALGPVSGTRALRLLLAPAERACLGPLGRTLLAGNGLHADLAPHQRGSGAFGVALCLLAHTVGWPSPRGGAGALARALLGAAAAAGATVRCEAAAEAIEIAGGRVRGVIAAGERIPCREVVCDTSPSELARLAGPGLPDRYARALLAFRHADGAFKVDWALAEPVPWRDEPSRHAGTVHLGGDVATLAAQAAERRGGRLPDQPFLLVGQQSLADPTRAPAGRHTLWAYGLVPRRVEWDGSREAVADRFEAAMERYAPGFRERVLARVLHAPPDLERLNRNLVGGDVSGGAVDGTQLLLRPAARAVPHRTPVHGLALGSASTPPGGGVHGACGANAARALLG
jgi:phytoene dehydrogenase-like protein